MPACRLSKTLQRLTPRWSSFSPTAIEGEAERAGLQDKLYELAINQVSITLATNYRRLSATKFPGLPPSYEGLVESMVKTVALGEPDGHLLKEIKSLEVGNLVGLALLREELDRLYQTYLGLCRRTHKVPVTTKQIVVGINLPWLPQNLGA